MHRSDSPQPYHDDGPIATIARGIMVDDDELQDAGMRRGHVKVLRKALKEAMA